MCALFFSIHLPRREKQPVGPGRGARAFRNAFRQDGLKDGGAMRAWHERRALWIFLYSVPRRPYDCDI